MSARSMQQRTRWLSVVAVGLAAMYVTQAHAQKVREDFNDASATGGGVFLDGQGYDDTAGAGWDDQLSGENAFGQTFGNVHGQIAAVADPVAGTAGTGAGKLTVSGINLNMIEQRFNAASATGGGAFLLGGGGADTLGISEDWDFGFVGESAFAQTTGGAVLNGSVSADGCLTCGVSSGPGSRLVVDDVTLNGGSWDAELIFAVPGFSFGSGPLLFNRSFDHDAASLAPWVGVGNALVGAVTPRSGANTLKMYGTFNGQPNFSTAYQEVSPAAEGQTWKLSCYVRHNDTTGDPLGDYLRAGCLVRMKIGFYTAGDVLLSTTGVKIIDENDPRDVYIHAGPISAIAPATTAKARAIFQFYQPDGAASGAAIVDDVEFELVGLDLTSFYNQFNLTAQVKGEASGGGETLGNYQLRLQDPGGNSLVFSEFADGSFQSVGGALDGADERNELGVSSNGAFDATADSYVAVVAFDNDASAWGTGGSLTVDDITLTNSYPSPADDYVAGLIWDQLPNLGADRTDKLLLTADIKGSVPGGAYQLRVEGYNAVPCLDEDFADVTSNSEYLLAGPGGAGAAVANWNDQLVYEQAVFGLEGGVIADETGGAWVRGLPNGGVGDSPCAEIEVTDILPDPDGLWYAGIYWQNQTLGTTNLSEISLTADVKGDWNAGFFQLAPRYTIRIEDPDGDYVGFDGTVPDTAFHTIGGFLDDANTNGTVSGGDGIFDVSTTGSYTVIVLFAGKGGNLEGDPFVGNTGGKLTVDNVALSPCGEPALQQVGYVAFDGVASNSFQTVGGLLSVADLSTFTGIGGVFWSPLAQPGGIPEWDVGLEGEDAFAGHWGDGYINGEVSAQGCTNCGTNGSGGAYFQWDGSGRTTANGGWWAGVAWRPVFAFTSLDQVRLRGDFRAEWDEDAGQLPGVIYFRLESDTNYLRSLSIPASVTSDGWGHIDDTLDHGTIGFSGDLTYDGTEREYSLVVISFGVDSPDDWASGGTIYFDDLEIIVNGLTIFSEDFETAVGPRLAGLRNPENRQLDAYTVVASIEQGGDTWGMGGATLTVDNLRLALAGSCDGDDDLDLMDFAGFQRCFGGDGSGECECADTDADGDVDAADAAVFPLFLEGP